MKNKHTNILVTGGAGNIGTNLCNELCSRGHTVLAIDLYNTECDNYVRCDIRNYRQLESVFDEFGPFNNPSSVNVQSKPFKGTRLGGFTLIAILPTAEAP